jgi:hypothetical protein
VPEATVDEDGNPRSTVDEVRTTTREAFNLCVSLQAQAQPLNFSSNCLFGSRPVVSDSLHAFGSGG